MTSQILAAPPPTRHSRRAARLGYSAATWAALYGVLALFWTVTGDGYPFGPNDPGGQMSLLRLLPAEVGAPLFAGVMLVTAVAALAMAGPRTVRLRGVPRALLLTYGWLVTAALLLVVPDFEVLALAGYAPMLILSLPFGGLPVDYAEVFDWTLLNKGLAVVNGLLLAGTVLTWQRRTAGSCLSCGRGTSAATWTSPVAAARWGRWAAWIAAVIPMIYALTRFAWLVGLPLGVPRETLEKMEANGALWSGAGLGAFAMVGGLLTLGLVQRWGEVFPRWMIGLAGRRVPVKLAVVPASFVTIAVASASLGFFANPQFLAALGDLDGASAPILLFPIWAVALGAATLAYHLRRRGTCIGCERS